MTNHACSIFCRDCESYVTHDSTFDTSRDKCSLYCSSCKKIVSHTKIHKSAPNYCLEKNKNEKDFHHKLECIKEKLCCKFNDCCELERELKHLLKNIENLIRDDIAIDQQILAIVQSIQITLQNVNNNVNTILSIVQNINNNINTILLLVQQILELINEIIARFCTPISSVPYVISEPGCYIITNELAFTGPGIAITITTNDVTLDGGNFTLTLTGSTAVGVQGNGFSNIKIRNLNVTSDSTDPTVNTANRSITFINADNILVENVHTSYTNRGLTFGTVKNSIIRDSVFENHLNDLTRLSIGIFITADSSNILIQNNKIANTNTQEDIGRGIYIQGSVNGPINNIRVVGCQFLDAGLFTLDFSAANLINNITVEDSQFNITNPEYQGWSVLFVSEAGGLVVKNITVKNCQFTNANSSIFFEPILLVGVSGAILSGLNVTANSPGNFIDRGIINVALIHLGYSITGIIDTEDIPDAQVENVTIENCTLNGGTSLQTAHQNTGIYIEAFSKNIVIDAVNISQTGVGNLAPPTIGDKISRRLRRRIIADLESEQDFQPVAKKAKTNIITRKNKRDKKSRSKLNASKTAAVAKAPPIPDQRAAAILVDGASNVTIKNSVISGAGSGTPGTLPGSGIVFSPFLQFQSIPGFTDPPLTIDVPPTSRSQIINCVVSSNTGAGIINAGDFNSIVNNNTQDNTQDGILSSGVAGFYNNNNSSRNTGVGIENIGINSVFTNNISVLNAINYVNVPVIVAQGQPALAGQNIYV